ncbi:hypothetical protein [Dyella sp.]|uniref:hypothetical protein n=1 Tax=Dyella sp. TaxID=1869338 RepID=UPI002B475080|nr:hypothetical protein [Dyella sp.]HKT26880.1 hypothetical protein [Dyella sp.]
MSFAALCLVAGHVIFFGHARETDESATAHLFQLLITLQIPVIAFFAFKWLRRNPKYAVGILALQALAGAVACAPVWYFKL